jgi:uncharacterized protein with HEPN domain
VGKHNPNQALADSLEQVERALSIVQRHGFQAVRGDFTLTDALLHNVLIASEAITQLKNEWPERYFELERSHPGVNWYAFRRMGDVIRHAYGEIDLTIIEQHLNGLVPAVKSAIQAELVLSRIELPPDGGG